MHCPCLFKCFILQMMIIVSNGVYFEGSFHWVSLSYGNHSIYLHCKSNVEEKTILQVKCLRTDNSMRYISQFMYVFVYSCMNNWTNVRDVACISYIYLKLPMLNKSNKNELTRSRRTASTCVLFSNR